MNYYVCFRSVKCVFSERKVITAQSVYAQKMRIIIFLFS